MEEKDGSYGEWLRLDGDNLCEVREQLGESIPLSLKFKRKTFCNVMGRDLITVVKIGSNKVLNKGQA